MKTVKHAATIVALFVLAAANAPAGAPDEDEPTGPHFTRAVELYAGGPDAAPAVLAELDLEIADHPDSMQARILKARTLKGTNHCKEALVVLDDADRIAEAADFISGGAKFLRAECFYYEGRYAESKRILTAYWAFMTRSPSAKKKYDELLAMVERKLPQGSSANSNR